VRAWPCECHRSPLALRSRSQAASGNTGSSKRTGAGWSFDRSAIRAQRRWTREGNGLRSDVRTRRRSSLACSSCATGRTAGASCRCRSATSVSPLSVIRAVADECAESGLLDQPTAAAIGRVKGVPVRGVRAGNWLTRDQAEKLLLARPNTLRGAARRRHPGPAHRLRPAPQRVGQPGLRAPATARGRWVIVHIVGRAVAGAPCRCRAEPRRSSMPQAPGKGQVLANWRA
jgi:hypothetical protein